MKGTSETYDEDLLRRIASLYGHDVEQFEFVLASRGFVKLGDKPRYKFFISLEVYADYMSLPGFNK